MQTEPHSPRVDSSGRRDAEQPANIRQALLAPLSPVCIAKGRPNMMPVSFPMG